MTDNANVKPEPRPRLNEKLALTTRGRACPDCGCRHFKVTNTYWIKGGLRRRLYKCRHCGYAFSTTERRDED